MGDVVYVIVTLFLVMTFIAVFSTNNMYKIEQELGQAICSESCSERFGMDFDSYDDKVLKCKLIEIKATRNQSNSSL